MKKQGAIKRETVFFIAVAVIIIATILIIIFMNRGNGNIDTDIGDPKNDLGADFNPDATPETNPSIGGVDNVEEVDGQKVNTSSKLEEEKTVGVYTFSNITMVGSSIGTVITANISSDVTEKTSGRDATMKFYDRTGRLVSQMDTYIPQVKPGETAYFRTETSSDVSNAYDFEIVLK